MVSACFPVSCIILLGFPFRKKKVVKHISFLASVYVSYQNDTYSIVRVKFIINLGISRVCMSAHPSFIIILWQILAQQHPYFFIPPPHLLPCKLHQGGELSCLTVNPSKHYLQGVHFFKFKLTIFLLLFSVVLFSEFLCDRLKDHYTIIPHALFGILSLVRSVFLYS